MNKTDHRPCPWGFYFPEKETDTKSVCMCVFDTSKCKGEKKAGRGYRQFQSRQVYYFRWSDWGNFQGRDDCSVKARKRWGEWVTELSGEAHSTRRDEWMHSPRGVSASCVEEQWGGRTSSFLTSQWHLAFAPLCFWKYPSSFASGHQHSGGVTSGFDLPHLFHSFLLFLVPAF